MSHSTVVVQMPGKQEVEAGLSFFLFYLFFTFRTTHPSPFFQSTKREIGSEMRRLLVTRWRKLSLTSSLSHSCAWLREITQLYRSDLHCSCLLVSGEACTIRYANITRPSLPAWACESLRELARLIEELNLVWLSSNHFSQDTRLLSRLASADYASVDF